MTRFACLSMCALMSCNFTSFLSAADHAAQNFDWSQWRGPNRDGKSSETSLLQKRPADGPQLVWKALKLGPGFSSVSIQNGRIFTMGDRDGSECVIALDSNDSGKELWAAQVSKSSENEGYPGPCCTPTADGDFVFALGSRGDLVCCEAATSRIVWQKNMPADFGGKMMSGWGYSESPLVDGQRLICTPGCDKAMMIALDKRTGREIWRCAMPKIGENGSDGAGYSSIVISNGGGRKQYVQFVGRGLIGVSASDGKFLWGYNKIANSVANISTPIVEGDFVFDSAAYQSGAVKLKLIATDAGIRAEEVYVLPPATLQNHHGGMVLVGDYLYAGHGQMMGLPLCLDWKTGRVVWGGDKRGPGEGSAAVTCADGRLYFRYEDGTMALLAASPDGYKLCGSFKIPDVQ